MSKEIVFGILLLFCFQNSGASELRHGVSFELPEGYEEVSPCELPKSNPKIIPIASFYGKGSEKIKLYMLKDAWLPKNRALLRNLEEEYKGKYEVIKRDGKTFGEYMSYIELTNNINKLPDMASYFLRERNDWRLMIETEYRTKEERESILDFLDSLKITEGFPSTNSSNQDFSQWAKTRGEWAPDCETNNRPKAFFSKPLVYPINAQINRITAKLIIRMDIDTSGYVSTFSLEGENSEYFHETIESYLKSMRYQIKLKDGKPVEQKGVIKTLEFDIE